MTKLKLAVRKLRKYKKPRQIFLTGLSGAGGVTRTRDLLITSEMLYRLSYTSLFTIADYIIRAAQSQLRPCRKGG